MIQLITKEGIINGSSISSTIGGGIKLSKEYFNSELILRSGEKKKAIEKITKGMKKVLGNLTFIN